MFRQYDNKYEEFLNCRAIKREQQRMAKTQTLAQNHTQPAEATHTFSYHAIVRAEQRGVNNKDIDYVLEYAKPQQQGKAIIYYLRHRDIPANDQRTQERLAGTALIVSASEPLIITVWRNRKSGSHKIRRKRKSFMYQPVTMQSQLF